MDPTQRRTLASYSLEVSRDPVTRYHHAARVAHAVRATHPHNTLLYNTTRYHSSIAHPALPQNEDNGQYEGPYQEANDSCTIPGMGVSGTELQRQEEHE